MIGILVILAVSWVLLYLVKRKDLRVLGFEPIGTRVVQFGQGFLMAGILCGLTQCIELVLSNASWAWNDQITLGSVLGAVYWDFKSVLTEELIYRGALLYLLMQWGGSRRAMLISAAAFGIYHWFSFGVLGNLIPMIFVFIGTGLMGYAWAFAYHKTSSIFLAFGLHLGWNTVFNTVFSKGPLGVQMLLIQGGEPMGDWLSLLNFFLSMIMTPVITLMWIKYKVHHH